MNKKSLKEKIVAHKEEIVLGLVAVGTLVLSAYVVNEASKAENNKHQTIQDAINRGDTVLQNPDGSFWIITNK